LVQRTSSHIALALHFEQHPAAIFDCFLLSAEFGASGPSLGEVEIEVRH
jgi:hypothetical protein